MMRGGGLHKGCRRLATSSAQRRSLNHNRTFARLTGSTCTSAPEHVCYRAKTDQNSSGVSYAPLLVTALLGTLALSDSKDGHCRARKGDPSAAEASAMEDYQMRLRKLTSLREVFDSCTGVEIAGEKFLTQGDFLRAMLAYKYVRVEPKELRRRCAKYSNNLLGNDKGLISYNEFCFLTSLVNIPSDHFDVAFCTVDKDDSGTLDKAEFVHLMQRLMPEASNLGDNVVGSERLLATFFGEDGAGYVTKGQFQSFIRGLTRDANMAELRLYSRMVPAPLVTNSHTHRAWGILHYLGSLRHWASSLNDRTKPLTPPKTVGGGIGQMETISNGDLALTLVSSCEPKRLAKFLERIGNLKKPKAQVPIDDAIRLHEILEEHCGDLEDALALYCQATGGGVQGEDLARAIKVVSGHELRPQYVSLLFDIFDESGDGELDHEELMSVIKVRRERQLGKTNVPPGVQRFVACVQDRA